MMQLLEVKNDIAKIIYNPADNKLLPSDFLLIEDSNQKLVGQILSVYTTEDSTNNFADVRLALYIDKNDKLSYYNGYIPPRTAKVMYITADEITEMVADSEVNIYLGNLTYHPKSIVKTPLSLINDRLYIQCDREDNRKIILQNIVSELYMKQRKVVLLDFDGRFNKIANVPRLVISESFKFPLNAEAFDTILEFDTADCPIEDKAVIQGIVLELIDYIKTLQNNFLPFTLFKNVIISEFAANPISGLMLLRNKLWQYAQDGLFAESKADFDIINRVLEHENIAIIDASKIDEKWHKFTIQTIPKILNKHCYFALSMNDIPMDKRSILSLYNNSNIVPIVSTSYDSPFRNILKSLSKNQILFKPSKQAEVDEQYGSLIHKLNSNDFILFGDASLNLPLIVDLKPFDIKTSERIEEQEIRRNVDRILSTGKSMLPKEAVLSETKQIKAPVSAQYIVDEDFNDEDLDFLDNVRSENISVDDLKSSEYPQETPKEEYDLFAPFTENSVGKNQDFSQLSELSKSDDLPKNNSIMQFDLDELTSNIEKSEEIVLKPEIVVSEYEQNSENTLISREETVQTDVCENSNIETQQESSTESNNTNEETTPIEIVQEIETEPQSIEDEKEEKEEQKPQQEQKQEDDFAQTGFSENIPDIPNLKYNEETTEKIEQDSEELLESKEPDKIPDAKLDYIEGDILSFDDILEENENDKTYANDILEGDIILHDDDNFEEEETIVENDLENYHETVVSVDTISSEEIENAVENEETIEITEDLQIESSENQENQEEVAVVTEENPQINSEQDEKQDNETLKQDEKALERLFNDDVIEVSQDDVEYEDETLEENSQDATENTEVETEQSENKEQVDVASEENIEEPQKEEEKIQVPAKKREDEIVSINSIIRNIKSKVKNSVSIKLKKEKEEEAIVKENREVTKNKPPMPVEITKNRVHKKELTVYETDTVNDITNENSLPFKVGDRVYHPKHGKGVVEGFANYSNKILFCQIEFENVGRRILDPRISGIEKID